MAYNHSLHILNFPATVLEYLQLRFIVKCVRNPRYFLPTKIVFNLIKFIYIIKVFKIIISFSQIKCKNLSVKE